MPSVATGAARAQQGALLAEAEPLAATRVGHLIAYIRAVHRVPLSSYHTLWQWSVDHPALFWESVWDLVGIVSSQPWAASAAGPATALHQPGRTDGSKPPLWPPPLWFCGSKLNVAENLLRYCAPGRPARNKVAVVSASEGRPGPAGDVTYTRAELWANVGSVAQALHALGVQPGDRVASYAINIGANLVAFLAASAVGAIWVSAAADLAPDAVLERLSTVRPKVLFTVTAAPYGGKLHDHLSKVDNVVGRLVALPPPEKQTQGQGLADIPPGLSSSPEDKLETVILMEDVKMSHSLAESARERDGRDGIRYLAWDAVLASSPFGAEDSIQFAQLEFNFPLWILFSSGTTGLPKAIVHRAGGMLLQLAKEHMLQGDLCESDVFHYYTSVGWMMWNWSVCALFTGATVVLYNGHPLAPTGTLWDLASRLGITVFGTSAAYLSALATAGYQPRKLHSGLKVHTILSTASPLRADLYPWILDSIGDVLIGSISGGTDICCAFGAQCPALPMYAGEVQCRGLAMDVQVDDGTGKDLPPGREGDLVCRTVFPSQPLGFWNQPWQRYFDAYYAETPGSWHHGDFVLLTEHAGLVMRGRSDGVLNPHGVRFGSSDLYDVLDGANTGIVRAINDSLAVGLRTPLGDDEVVVLLLDVSPAVVPDKQTWNQLVREVQNLIRTSCSPRHVPHFVVRLSEGGVPKTLNGKKVEVPIKKILNGQPISIVNPSTLQNPEVLPQYATIAQQLRKALQSQARL